MLFVLSGLIAAIAVLMIYIRLAPSRAAQWHDPQTPNTGVGQFPAMSGHIEQRTVEAGQDGRAQLTALDQIIRTTPRTMCLAGSLEQGKLTYITRSALWGFPDYTTISLLENASTDEAAIQIFGRLRFGRSDLGVNRKRIEGWLAQLDARSGTDTPSP